MRPAFLVSLSSLSSLGSLGLSPCTCYTLRAVIVLTLSVITPVALTIWRHFSKNRSVCFNNLSWKLEPCVPQTIVSNQRLFDVSRIRYRCQSSFSLLKKCIPGLTDTSKWVVDDLMNAWWVMSTMRSQPGQWGMSAQCQSWALYGKACIVSTKWCDMSSYVNIWSSLWCPQVLQPMWHLSM